MIVHNCKPLHLIFSFLIEEIHMYDGYFWCLLRLREILMCERGSILNVTFWSFQQFKLQINTADPSPSFAPSTPLTNTTGDVISMPSLQPGANSSKVLVMF